MSKYQELMAKIADLQQQAEAVRQSERAQVIAEIREKIASHDLTAQDLGLSTTRATRSSKGSGRPRAAVKAKYRDPASGKTWTGRGITPKWLQAAIDAGRSRDDFLI